MRNRFVDLMTVVFVTGLLETILMSVIGAYSTAFVWLTVSGVSCASFKYVSEKIEALERLKEKIRNGETEIENPKAVMEILDIIKEYIES